jgi:DNA-binding NtrC family response regulator
MIVSQSRTAARLPGAPTPINTASASNPETRSSANSVFVGHSAAFRSALSELESFAAHDGLTVLIEGESGTGKTYFARHLHNKSPRASKDFHTVMLSALDEFLAGSDLFGHLDGAFTDARRSRAGHLVGAGGGTLFLDEIGKLSLSVQRKLLHVIEHREVWPLGSDRPVRVNARMVAATNIPLETLVNQGAFLPDLHARFGFFRVRIPPLRERRADIPALVEQFLQARASDFGYGAVTPRVAPELLNALRAAPWPYNVRELDSAVQRLLVEARQAPVLTLDHCCGSLGHLLSARPNEPLSRDEAEQAVRVSGSVSAAARSLRVARTTVYRALHDRGSL